MNLLKIIVYSSESLLVRNVIPSGSIELLKIVIFSNFIFNNKIFMFIY